MLNDSLNEESSVCEGTGYDETFGPGDEFEDFSPSSKRETSAQSLDGEDEDYAEGSEGVGVDELGKERSGGDGGDNDDRRKVMVIMMMTGRMVTVTRRMMERSLVKGS